MDVGRGDATLATMNQGAASGDDVAYHPGEGAALTWREISRLVALFPPVITVLEVLTTTKAGFVSASAAKVTTSWMRCSSVSPPEIVVCTSILS